MKNQWQTIKLATALAAMLLVSAVGAGRAAAQVIITEIIDAAGDGAGNVLDAPFGIAVDGAGNAYMVGRDSDNAFKITPGGAITEIIDATGDGAGNGLNVPVGGIVVDAAGNAYLTGQLSANAFKITPAGVITEIIDFSGDGAGNGLLVPTGIAVDAAGNAYVTGQSSDNAFKITPAGVITEIIDAAGDGAGNGCDGPLGIAVDAAGNAYVAGNVSSNAFKITPGGAITEIIDATGDGAGNGLNVPFDIAVDAAGNAYVPGRFSDNAFKITPAGVITEIIDANGDGAGNILDSPLGIAVDAAGNVYVTGLLSHNAFKITELMNQPPMAVAGDDQSIHAGDTVLLDGSTSFDDNTASEDLTYAWTMTQKPAGSTADQTLTGADSATPSFVADLPGTYVLSLVVTDEGGLPSAADTVTISSLNLAPTANAGADFGAILGDLVILDGSASSDPDNDALTFSWSITAAPAGSQASLNDATTASPTFEPDLAGSYAVQLTVGDGFESSPPDEVVISVITAGDFAENNTMEALNCVSALPPSDVTTPGNQNALGNFMTQAIEALQSGDIEEAINKLNKALIRTDGCVLRGEPDGNGPGRDWITDCVEQTIVYQLLQDALNALTP